MTVRELGNYICHHGILGQKHGVLNGPPYPLGSGEHSSNEKKAARQAGIDVGTSSGQGSIENVKVDDDIPTDRGSKSADESANSRRAKVQAAIKSGNREQVKKYASEMTTNELRDAIAKIDLMADLNKTSPSKKTFDKIDKAVSAIDKAGKYYDTATNTWNRFAKLYNAFNKDGDDLKIIGDNTPIKTAKEKLEEKQKKLVVNSGNAALIQKYANRMTNTELKDATTRLKYLDSIARRNYDNIKDDRDDK
ncbi:hypothetical protein [Lachnoclostridium sp. Marseille-P6806]|uniref:hypothetical protein n=1 Tax=Lachnoclostridium sp. Marseille-P6806 TaxID=2364793 RepID=UPI00102F8A01|nr:hypothetical protein [Lachnoclostridium sp. Marseille-P6806]